MSLQRFCAGSCDPPSSLKTKVRHFLVARLGEYVCARLPLYGPWWLCIGLSTSELDTRHLLLSQLVQAIVNCVMEDWQIAFEVLRGNASPRPTKSGLVPAVLSVSLTELHEKGEPTVRWMSFRWFRWSRGQYSSDKVLQVGCEAEIGSTLLWCEAERR